jgi:ribonuclease P/MRP protein subunit RPP1
MKRAFADLHLCPSPTNKGNISKIVSKATDLGFHLIGLQSSPQNFEEEHSKLQNLSTRQKVDLVSRADIKPKSQSDLIRLLRRLRRKFEVICVLCESKEVARQAAKDHRVDLINFPNIDFHRNYFDRAEAELASKSSTALEFDLRSLLLLSGPSRVKLLSGLRREAAIALEFHVPIVISSGASDEWLLRKPREMAVLAELFGLSETQALNAVSINPQEIVTRNREKLCASYIAPGIRVLKEGEDC